MIGRFGQHGFTLIEVMVATAIVGISFGAICCLLAQSTRTASITGRYARATMLAESKLAELRTSGPLEPGVQQGQFEAEPGFAWHVNVTAEGTKGLNRVTMTVFFNAPGGKRHVKLHTLQGDRSLPKKQENQNP